MNRKLVLLGAFLLTMAATTQAQTTPDNRSDTTHHRFHRPDRQRFRGNAENFRGDNAFRGHRNFIHYTADQRKQVMAINKEYRQKRGDLFKQDNITLKQYKSGLVALDKEKKTKMDALLTPEQRSELASRKKKMEENSQVRQAGRIERLRLELNLTDDQIAKIKTGRQNLRNQMQSIHGNDNLLPQEKRQQMKALMASRNDDMKTILSPDQYTKFQELSRHHRFEGPRGPHRPWQSRGDFGGHTT
jgi:Spy/CpxP family protein refolding chaperone